MFELTYEEELKRKHGDYNYKLNLQLKDQLVTDFNIKININETQELDLESIDVRRESNEIYKLTSEELVSNITTNVDIPNQATIEYSDQENSVQDWIFNVEQEEIFSGLSIVNSQVILIPFQVQKQIKLVSETHEKGSQESRY